jgi:hypothetical protein
MISRQLLGQYMQKSKALKGRGIDAKIREDLSGVDLLKFTTMPLNQYSCKHQIALEFYLSALQRLNIASQN